MIPTPTPDMQQQYHDALDMFLLHMKKNDKVAPPLPCDCSCPVLTLDSAVFVGGNISGQVSFATDSTCDIKVILVAAPRYYSEPLGYEDGSQVFVATKTGTTGTLSLEGSAPYGTPPVGMVQVGWEVQAYVARKCDNLIIGWSNEINVPIL